MVLETNQTSWDRTFIKVAYEFAEHSSCCRKHVGAVITKNGRIISTGYNGTPHGLEHCNSYFENIRYSNNISWKDFNIKINKLGSELNLMHADFSKKFELHAEQNAIAYAAKNSIQLDGDDTTLYTTLSPCSDCAKLIAASGIKRVVYNEEYDRDTSGIKLLASMGIPVEKCELEAKKIILKNEEK